MKVAFVTLGLGVLLLLAGGGEGRRRRSCTRIRKERRFWTTMKNRVSCMEPKDQPVQLPIPDGYDFIHPDVVMLKKCSGLMCVEKQKSCVAIRTEPKKYTVEGHHMNSIDSMSCVKVSVEEDVECGCRCDKTMDDCTHLQVFNEQQCKCECREGLKEQCEMMMREKPNMYMWDEKKCTCPCNKKPQDCPYGKHWVPDVCSCNRIMN